MANAGSRPITAECCVDETIKRYPSTGPIFLQHGRLYVARPRELYATYPARTIAEYAAHNGAALGPLLKLLNAASEADEFAGRTRTSAAAADERRGWRARTPPIGPAGYTGSYREPNADIEDVPMVWVLEARGPE